MLKEILYSPYFGVALAIICFQIGTSIQKRLKTPIANPLFIAAVLIVVFLSIFNIPMEAFYVGSDLIGLFLAPATAALAVPMYKNLQVIKANLLPILLGTAVGSLSCVLMIAVFCRIFGLSEIIQLSMLSKSTTMPIAMSITEQVGGIVPITVVCVVFTGILGSIITPWLIKICRIDNEVAQGIGIGTCSHAVGTTKAVELGEVQGAMSGIAMGLAGLFTVFWALLLL